MTEDQDKLLREIHDALLKRDPKYDELLKAAQAVVDSRHSGFFSNALKTAILNLTDVLRRSQK